MSRRRLTGLDTAFLAAERPGNALHVMGVLLLDPSSMPGGYSFESLRSFLGERLPTLPPLRRRLVEVPGGLARPYWMDAGEIELDYHVRRAAAPAPGGPSELAAMAAAMMERPLDRRLPLWEMQVVEGLAGGRIALLAKLSHAMMDGVAGVRLMAQLVTPTPELPPLHAHAPITPDEVPGPLSLLADAVPWLAGQPLRAVRASLGSFRRRLARRPPEPGDDDGPEARVRRAWLNTALSPFREVAWCSLPLERLRAVGHANGASVNDALLAVAAGALRRYAEPRGVLPEWPLVASVPIAVRDEGDERANAVSAASVSLATDREDPIERLCAIRDATRAKKGRRGRSLGQDLAAWADVPPPLLFSLATSAYFDLDLASRMTPLCNLVVSSVPGPREALYLAGARLEAIYPLGPVFTGMALNITAIGWGDRMDVGLVACRQAVPELWSLADALPEALAELAGASPLPARASS